MKKSIKRIVSAIITASMTFTAVFSNGIAANAALGTNEIELNVEAEYNSTANTVTAKYIVEGNSSTKGFNNYTLTLDYDSSLLVPVSLTAGEITLDSTDALGSAIKVNAGNGDILNTNSGKIAYCIYNNNFANVPNGSLPEFTTDGVLFTVVYNVIGSGSTNVGATVKTFNTISSDETIESELAVSVTPATVTVEGSSYLPGDVNMDGNITSIDATLALLASANRTTLNAAQIKLADINNDGNVTSTDATIILLKSSNRA